MTIPEFVAALPALRDTYAWYADDLGELRGLYAPQAFQVTPLTALAYAQTGEWVEWETDWERAGELLGLTLEDASTIVGAEDRDAHHDAALARAMRAAVGVEEGDAVT